MPRKDRPIKSHVDVSPEKPFVDSLGRVYKKRPGKPTGVMTRAQLMKLAKKEAMEGRVESPKQYLLDLMNAPMPPELLPVLMKAYKTVDLKELALLIPELCGALQKWHAFRAKVAEAVMPYEHPRLTAQTIKGDKNEPITVVLQKPGEQAQEIGALTAEKVIAENARDTATAQ